MADPLNLNILLISTYEMGRQPFGLASPAAWLRQAGFDVRCLDLSLDPLDAAAVRAAGLIGFYVPMHMATRMAVPIIAQVRQLNPAAHLCAFGLYAPVTADYLHSLGVDALLGGEFESGLVALARRIGESANRRINEEAKYNQTTPPALHPPLPCSSTPPPLISLARQPFLTPDRRDLPALSRYAHLVKNADEQIPVGYTEASRGCKHLCRHCPIVPVYEGHFRIVPPEVVLADIRQQVAAGAQHITFGDPDFFNGPGHTLPLVKALHREFPRLTYDVTIKIEHLLQQARHLPTLKETGCLFITSAVESFDESILTIFDKRHTKAEFVNALKLCRQLDLLLVPTFVAFTPWTTLAGYRAFLQEIVELGLVEQVSPIQLAIRLLIPPGSRLLQLPEVQKLVGELDQARLAHVWRSPDPAVDELQRDLEYLVQYCAGQHVPRREVFRRVWERAYQGSTSFPNLSPASRFTPYLTEPWYC